MRSWIFTIPTWTGTLAMECEGDFQISQYITGFQRGIKAGQDIVLATAAGGVAAPDRADCDILFDGRSHFIASFGSSSGQEGGPHGDPLLHQLQPRIGMDQIGGGPPDRVSSHRNDKAALFQRPGERFGGNRRHALRRGGQPGAQRVLGRLRLSVLEQADDL